MSKKLSEWQPSNAALDLIKLNGLTDKMVDDTLAYLKNKTDLENIDDVEGYDNWDAFFIMFCVKANKNTVSNA